VRVAALTLPLLKPQVSHPSASSEQRAPVVREQEEALASQLEGLPQGQGESGQRETEIEIEQP
jgi:hypothetical protein